MHVVGLGAQAILKWWSVFVVEKTVEVAEGGVSNDIMPVLKGELAGEEAAPGRAVVEDFERVVAFRISAVGRPVTPIVGAA